MARLLFHSQEYRLGLGRPEAEHNAARRGTMQYEVLRTPTPLPFALATRSPSTSTAASAPASWTLPIRYGVAASLEMATIIQANIHAKVRQSLQVRQRQQITPRSLRPKSWSQRAHV